MLQAAQLHPDQIISILLNRNYGQHSVIMAGFEYCRGEAVITLDADLQIPPEDSPKLRADIDRGCDVDAMLGCHQRNSFIPILANSFGRNTRELEVEHAISCTKSSTTS